MKFLSVVCVCLFIINSIVCQQIYQNATRLEVMGFVRKTSMVTSSYAYCVAPSISVPQPDTIVPEGGLATLSCEVKGYPVPKVTWTKGNNKEAISPERHYNSTNNGTLLIIGTQQQDAGVYSCTANNNVGKPVNATIRLKIGAPTLREPEFIENNRFTVADLNDPITLQCNVLGWPPPTIRWWRTSNYINDTDERYEQPTQYSLKIRKFTMKDIGTYECRAFKSKIDLVISSPRNNFSHISHKFFLFVNEIKADCVSKNCGDDELSTSLTNVSTKHNELCLNPMTLGTSLSPQDLINLANLLKHDSQFTTKAKSLPDVTKLLNKVLDSSKPSVEEREVDSEATYSILKSVQTILDGLDLSEAENGTAMDVKSHTAIMVTQTIQTDVIGMMALTSDNMTLSEVKPLQAGVKDKDEDSANMVVRIKENTSTTNSTISKLSFVVYGNSRTFTQYNKKIIVDSHVVGVSAPEGEASMITSVQFELKPLNPNLYRGQKRQCAYWELEAGEWRTDGCVMLRHDVTTGRDVCECQRLAHFGLILGVEGVSPILHNISLTGCILSILGLLGIAITAIVFPKWRAQLGNKILLHLSLSIGIIMSTFLGIALEGTKSSIGCLILGIMLHYSVLAAFCWMLVTAVLQFFRLVIVFVTRPNRFLLKGALFGWGLPLVPVVTLLFMDPKSYANNNEDMAFCYPQGVNLIFGVITPVAIVVSANVIVFSIIIFKVTCGRGKTIKINANEASDKKLLIAQFKMSILLFFLLGLTWVFGLLALISPNYQEWQILFLYLFCTMATLQGFVLFLYFIILDKKARGYWIHALITKLDKPEEDLNVENVPRTVSSLITFLRTLEENNSVMSESREMNSISKSKV